MLFFPTKIAFHRVMLPILDHILLFPLCPLTFSAMHLSQNKDRFLSISTLSSLIRNHAFSHLIIWCFYSSKLYPLTAKKLSALIANSFPLSPSFFLYPAFFQTHQHIRNSPCQNRVPERCSRL